MTTLRVNGISLHVQVLAPVAERAAPAVLVHGLGVDTLASWYFTLAGAVNDTGRRVVMYDLRGHGRSERPATGYRLDDFVDDLAGLLAALGVTGPVCLLGNSFGGTVAFGYALRHPDRVSGIVAIESAPPTEEWLSRARRRLELPAGRERYGASTLAADLGSSRPADPAELAGITCPVLCVYGAESGLAAALPRIRNWLPQARMAVVPGQRHTVLVDAPAAVRELVLPWLDTLEGRHPDDRTDLGALDHHQQRPLRLDTAL
ncbi:alpha/beta fold hydrolase [Plantactinospora sp. CA-294935]|uniref:alpha/beta fold hydrolase n=1 Tax=Plantactinospora sp. CA-294935 TaxID=3240012 RepID=UPI003D907D10